MSRYGWQRKRSLYGNLNGSEDLAESEGLQDEDDLQGNNEAGDQSQEQKDEESSEIKKRLLNMFINSVLSTGTAIGGAKLAKWIGSTPAFAAGAVVTMAGYYTDIKPISGLGLGLIAGGLEKKPEQAVGGLGNIPANTNETSPLYRPLEKYFKLPHQPPKSKPLDMSAMDNIHAQVVASAAAFQQKQQQGELNTSIAGFGLVINKGKEEIDFLDRLI